MSYALALMHCERFYGPAFVFNPTRWPTPDGYLPFRLLLVAVLAMSAVRAAESMAAAAAAQMPHLERGDRQHLADALRAAATPEE